MPKRFLLTNNHECRELAELRAQLRREHVEKEHLKSQLASTQQVLEHAKKEVAILERESRALKTTLGYPSFDWTRQMPDDVTRHILSYVRGTIHFHLRGVCKLWAKAYYTRPFNNLTKLSNKRIRKLTRGGVTAEGVTVEAKTFTGTIRGLAWHKYRELAHLARVPNTRRLSFENTTLGDLSALQHTPKLEQLFTTGCKVDSLAFLEHTPALEVLDIWNDGMRRPLQLSTLPLGPLCLRHLKLERSMLRDLSLLSRMPALETLDLSNNRNLRLNTLPRGLTKLRVLKLVDCGLRDVSALARVPGVEVLRLCFNRFALKTLPESLSPLRKLRLMRCGLKDASALEHIVVTESLDLGANRRLDRSTVPARHADVLE